MKQIYVIALIFLPFMGFSQLKVTPENNKDHYVYVEKSMLFVEQGVDLTLNSSEDRKASIYLRDEAQLLQGKSSKNNTGNGLLSVFQEGKASNYTYNYWCAPVINVSGNTSFGNILFEPVDKTWSVPAKITGGLDGISNPLTISNKWIYKLAGKGYSDWLYIGKTFDISPGEGFTMKGVSGKNTGVIIYDVPNNPGQQQRYDFRGQPNNGEISLSLKEGASLLTGNPYPSALDLNLLLTQNPNTTGIAYFWDSRPISSHYLNDYEGGYGAYSPAAGNEGYVPAVFTRYDQSGNSIPTNTTGEYYARRYSPIAQGFVVIGRKDGDFVIKNAYRAFVKENTEVSEFKSQIQSEKTISDSKSFRLDIGFHSYTRELLYVSRNDATTGADWAMDAKNISSLSSDAGFVIDSEDYLIDVRPYELADVIPLHIKTAEKDTITFAISASENMPDDVFILDTLSHIYHDLKVEDFKVSLEKGDYSGRFKITFKNLKVVLEHPLPKDQIQEYSLFQNNPLSRVEIRTPSPAYPIQIHLYDVRGREIIKLPVDKNENYYEIPTHKLSKGVYVVKIIGPDGPIVSKKLIISN